MCPYGNPAMEYPGSCRISECEGGHDPPLGAYRVHPAHQVPRLGALPAGDDRYLAGNVCRRHAPHTQADRPGHPGSHETPRLLPGGKRPQTMTTPTPQGPTPVPAHPSQPCPRCNGKGTLPVPPAGTVVIPTVCSPRPGAPPWSPDPRIIAYYLRIPARLVPIAIKERQIRSKVIRGQRHYLLRDVQVWFDDFRDAASPLLRGPAKAGLPQHFLCLRRYTGRVYDR